MEKSIYLTTCTSNQTELYLSVSMLCSRTRIIPSLLLEISATLKIMPSRNCCVCLSRTSTMIHLWEKYWKVNAVRSLRRTYTLVTFYAKNAGRRFMHKKRMRVGQLEFSVPLPSWHQVRPLIQRLQLPIWKSVWLNVQWMRKVFERLVKIVLRLQTSLFLLFLLENWSDVHYLSQVVKGFAYTSMFSTCDFFHTARCPSSRWDQVLYLNWGTTTWGITLTRLNIERFPISHTKCKDSLITWF